MKKIKALLIDLDGTIYQNGKLIDNTLITIQKLNKNKVPFRFITNNTRKSRQSICLYLKKLGLIIDESYIYTTMYAAINYCKKNNLKKIKIISLTDEYKNDVSEIDIVESNPDAIILGDLSDQFNYNKLNEIFIELQQGAQLIALHKNRYWLKNNNITLDLGPFVSLLEYASNQRAIVIGKPNKNFFEIAAHDFNMAYSNIAVIGDDIESDVSGSINTGMQGVLVKTGKYIEKQLENSGIKPDYVLDSFSHITNYLFNDEF